MKSSSIIAIVAVVILAGLALFLGRGFFTSNAGEPAANVVAEDDTAEDNTAADVAAAEPQAQAPSYAEVVVPAVEQFDAWRQGPIAQRATKLEEKVEGVPLMTYGSMLVFWTGSRQSGKGDAASLETLANDHLRPTLVPIYEQIAGEAETIATSLRSVEPPADASADYERVLQCLDYEVGRSRYVLAALSGETVDTFPEQRPNPCDEIESSAQALAASAAQ